MDADALARLFAVLKTGGLEEVFHPHALTEEAARERANYRGRDLYVLLCEGKRALGYGMLRGWDDGHDVPSLGIAIHPDAQGQGLGRLLMDFLRVSAERHGANKIRLRVRSGNRRAISLYKSLGYQMVPEEASPYLVGFLTLGSRVERK
jgi:ribosomal protein S18 acetylase RimI-like enzyme